MQVLVSIEKALGALFEVRTHHERSHIWCMAQLLRSLHLAFAPRQLLQRSQLSLLLPAVLL